MVIQFIINGLITGILYSLVAIGFAFVYNTTKLFHIAAAAVFVFPAFIFSWFVGAMKIPILTAALISIVLAMIFSAIIDLSVYRPLQRLGASSNAVMIASIGIMTVVTNTLSILFGNDTKVIMSGMHRVFSFGNVIISATQMLQLVVGGIILVVFLAMLAKSSLGLRLRAYSSSATLFETLGYDSSWIRTLSFLMSGAFLATASCLSIIDTGMDISAGMNFLINAMVALIIGGAGRYGTCIIGGVTLGLIQSIVACYLSSDWQNMLTFILLIAFLLLRPQGIAGIKERTV